MTQWSRRELAILDAHHKLSASAIAGLLADEGYFRTPEAVHAKRAGTGARVEYQRPQRGWPIVPPTLEEQNHKFLSAVLAYVRQQRAA